ncbi:NYN domain-containing protein [Litorimonas haliclonae]|uniref:NYN domain-containing protein n=1 Tax=Litorimonas haliclonae TaxID=2081977 RepID=UPI0039F0BE3B
MRVAAYVDGYNVYHAIKNTRQNHHKWCDLKGLLQNFLLPGRETLVETHYFSALAHWKPVQMARHRLYIAALESTGVQTHLARFSEKTRSCRTCGSSWTSHEEKETDVKLAVHLLKDAALNKFDRALIVSRDSDLVPAAKVFKELYPDKELKVVAPYAAGHSTEMLNICDGKHKIQRKHHERFLLPATITLESGRIIERPNRYNPPS